MKPVHRHNIKPDKWYMLYTSLISDVAIQWIVLITPREAVTKDGLHRGTILWSYYFIDNEFNIGISNLSEESYEIHDESEFFELSEEEYLTHVISEVI